MIYHTLSTQSHVVLGIHLTFPLRVVAANNFASGVVEESCSIAFVTFHACCYAQSVYIFSQ